MAQYDRTVFEKTFKQEPHVLVGGEDDVVDARGMAVLNVIAGAGATVTVSRVDSLDAVTHTTSTVTSFPASVDWPFYRIFTTGGSCRWALV